MSKYKYTFGEMFGPFNCKLCRSECWSVYVDERPEEALDIMYKNLGEALCSNCAPEKWEPGSFSLASMIPD